MVKTTLIVALVMCAGLTLTLFSGCYSRNRAKTPEDRVAFLEKHIADELDLSETQQDQLREMMAAVHDRAEQMKADHAESRAMLLAELKKETIDTAMIQREIGRRMDAFNTLVPELLADYAAFHRTLSPAQREKLVAAIERHRERHKRFHRFHKW